jgi:hypothetical protein
MTKTTKIIAGVVAGLLGVGVVTAVTSGDGVAWARRASAMVGVRGGMGGHGGYGMGGQGGSGMSGVMAPALPANPAPATPALVDALTRALAEEQLAEATYDAVVAKLGAVAPFTNISRSESMHIAAVERVAADHGITLTTSPPTPPAIPSTLSQACAIGVAAEKADIALYDTLLPTVQAWPDVVQAFTNLRHASQDMHLPAFSRCA